MIEKEPWGEDPICLPRQPQLSARTKDTKHSRYPVEIIEIEKTRIKSGRENTLNDTLAGVEKNHDTMKSV
jgi:hypothetical protein